MTNFNVSNKAGEVVKTMKIPDTIGMAVGMAGVSAAIGVMVGAGVGFVKDVQDLVKAVVKK